MARKHKSMKKIFISLTILFVVSTITFGVYYQKYQLFLKESVFKQATLVEIEKGQSFRTLIQKIVENNGNGEDWQWRLFAKLEKVGGWLKVGEFEIDSSATPMQLMQKIKNNKVITYDFTIVEGMNWRELKQKLLNDPVLVHSLNDLSDTNLLEQLGVDNPNPEGLFLPETYQFIKGDSDLDILLRAHKDLNKILDSTWSEIDSDLPYSSPYQLLIMASIVEKETSVASERDEIAGVFVRRLHKNMRLQTDPTVIYGIGESYDGDIRKKDLQTDTPYNTYTRHGLPPTPIAMASKESIIASANPKPGNSLYFVANNRGGHYFSDTYKQHQNAVKDFLKGIKL
jgi:UPF0755 protein